MDVNSLKFFDSAATTPCLQSAVSRWVECQEHSFANPSSAHRLGREAAQQVASARAFFGEVFGVPSDQVIFTASGSESDNLAVIGGALAAKRGHVAVSAGEHPAVKMAAWSLRDFGFDVSTLPIDAQGQVQVSALEAGIRNDTVVVSVMKVNNIVGSINDVDALARAAKRRQPGVLVHCDAVQAFGKVDVPRAGSAVDALSISGHKIHGPKGIGALILLNRNLLTEKRIRPLVWGGGQEQGLRAGTTNAGLISAFAEAAREALRDQSAFAAHCTSLGVELEQELARLGYRWGETALRNSPQGAVPYILNVSFAGAPATLMSKLLEDEGYFVSTGSACSSTKPERDATLTAMGLEASRIDAALRISFSSQNTLDEVRGLARALDRSYGKLRALFKKPA